MAFLELEKPVFERPFIRKKIEIIFRLCSKIDKLLNWVELNFSCTLSLAQLRAFTE
jgi:hypothetical protein